MPFEALLQPAGLDQVNSTVDAVGFDFIKQPKVSCTYTLTIVKGVRQARISIDTFLSEALAKGVGLRGNREALATVLVDYDYPFEESKGSEPAPPFELDQVFYAADLEAANWCVDIPEAKLGAYMMLIYLDVFGNEYVEVKPKTDFISSASPSAEHGILI